MNIKQELKKTSRNVQFLINAGIIFTSLYKINESDIKLVKILSIVTAGLAVLSQVVLFVEDMKEEWNAPDDGEIEDTDEE